MSAIELDTVVNRPRQEVFEYLARGENLSQWMETFESVQPTSQGAPGPGSTYQYTMSRGGESTFEYSDFVPGQRIAWTGPPAKSTLGEISMRGSFDLQDQDGGTRIGMSLDPALSGAMKAVGPVMRRQMKKEAEGDLSRLKQLLEARS